MKTVLFVCVHNSGRSQMAEAFLNQLAKERGVAARALSAGTEPAAAVQPEAVDVMREVGIDVSQDRPKPKLFSFNFGLALGEVGFSFGSMCGGSKCGAKRWPLFRVRKP